MTDIVHCRPPVGVRHHIRDHGRHIVHADLVEAEVPVALRAVGVQRAVAARGARATSTAQPDVVASIGQQIGETVAPAEKQPIGRRIGEAVHQQEHCGAVVPVLRAGWNAVQTDRVVVGGAHVVAFDRIAFSADHGGLG